ncbi:MAG: epoxyqueuosine reductase QueH [Synergistaceae bacterium]|nr:epoxyqueuosine reductase QueH [Synergistaceae bacterium]
MDRRKTRLILHICCAPDATVPADDLLEEGYQIRGFFYGSNIHPADEFEKRAAAVISLCHMKGIEFHVMPYDPEGWLMKTEKLASEPEGGRRCSLCFELQLRAAAEYAVRNGAGSLATTLTISPHKDPCLINSIGERVSSEHGLIWVPRVWRKNNGFKKSVDESKRLGLYRQVYCGCIYSIRNR